MKGLHKYCIEYIHFTIFVFAALYAGMPSGYYFKTRNKFWLFKLKFQMTLVWVVVPRSFEFDRKSVEEQ